MSILKTKNYSAFKFIDNNRDIIPGHLEEMVENIKKENFTQWVPVIVNEKMEIIDGQHRVKACQAADIEVCYVIKPGATDADIIDCNMYNEKWRPVDFVEYWASKGNDNYQFLLDLSQKYKIGLPSVIRFINISRDVLGHGRLTFSKERKIYLDNLLQKSSYLAHKIYELCIGTETNRAWPFTPTCLRALGSVLSHPQVDPEDFVAKLTYFHTALHRKSSCSQYISLFLSVLNWKKRQRIEEEDVNDHYRRVM